MKAHKLIVTYLALLLNAITVNAQYWNEVQKIVSSTKNYNYSYGTSSAIHGSNAIVSAQNEVFFHQRDSNGFWKETQSFTVCKLKNSYNLSVDIFDKYAVVGIPLKDSVINGKSYRPGEVIIFERDTNDVWTLFQKLSPDSLSNIFVLGIQYFGADVEIDSNRLIVGMPKTKGEVYYYERTKSKWELTQKLTGFGKFGQCVSLHKKRLCIGSPDDPFNAYGQDSIIGAGLIHYYTLDTNGYWVRRQSFHLNKRNLYDRFGEIFSMHDSTLLSGTTRFGCTFFTLDTTGTWYQDEVVFPTSLKYNHKFGQTLALSKNYAVIGAPYADHTTSFVDDNGYIFLYEKHRFKGWTEIKRIPCSVLRYYSHFGISLSTDDSTIFVGNDGFTQDHNFNNQNHINRTNYVIINQKCEVKDSTLFVTACDSFVSPSKKYTYYTSGYHIDEFLSPNTENCDTIIHVRLTLLKSSHAYLTIQSCESYTSPSGTKTWFVSGNYTDTLTNDAGCDSFIHIQLTIHKNKEVYDTISTCDSLISPSGRYIWTTTGKYHDTISTVAGCDSIINLYLVVNKPSTTNITMVKCEPSFSPSGKYFWSKNGTYQDTIPKQNGCDSAMNISFEISKKSRYSIEKSVCNSDYLSPSGKHRWTKSGIYKDTIQNRFGCDSALLEIDLTINTFPISYTFTNDSILLDFQQGKYNWFRCDKTPISAIQNEHEYYLRVRKTGKYLAEIQYGECFDTTDCIYINQLSIEELFDAAVSIFPNPSTGKIEIVNPDGLNRILISNNSGQNVYETSFKNVNYANLDLDKLPKGMYFIHVYSGENNQKYAVRKLLLY